MEQIHQTEGHRGQSLALWLVHFLRIRETWPSGCCSSVEVPRNCICNALLPSIFNVNSLVLTSCSPARIYRLISELLENYSGVLNPLSWGWRRDGLAWPWVLQASSGGGSRREEEGGVCGGSVCACQGGQRGFICGRQQGAAWGHWQLWVTAVSVLGKMLVSASHVENPVSSFSLPFSPLMILPGVAPLQMPAAPRPAHLSGRETRFVSARWCAVCAAAPCCSHPALLLFAPSSSSAFPGSWAWCTPRAWCGEQCPGRQVEAWEAVPC